MFKALPRFVDRFAHDAAGSVIIIFSFVLPVMLGFLGLAIDYGAWNLQRTKLQNAADSAALAGARVYSDTQNPSAADDQANSSLAAHGSDAANPNVGLADGDTTYQVTLQESGADYFSGLFMQSPPVIGVSAKASINFGPGPCIVALDPDASQSIWVDTNAQINALDCKVQANSTSGSAIHAANNSKLNSEATCTAGGYSGANSHYNPVPVQCAPAADPLANVPAPSVGSCTYNDTELDNANTTLSPGVYCGGLSIMGDSNVTFSAGTYIIKDGKFFVDSTSRISGSRVTFYLTGTGATIEFTSNTVVDFTAPTTGPLAGVIFFEDRNAPFNREHYFDSNNISRLEGAIYLSRGLFWSDSNTQIAADSAFTIVVANRIRLDSNATLVLNADYDGSDVPALTGTAGGRIRLIH